MVVLAGVKRLHPLVGLTLSQPRKKGRFSTSSITFFFLSNFYCIWHCDIPNCTFLIKLSNKNNSSVIGRKLFVILAVNKGKNTPNRSKQNIHMQLNKAAKLNSKFWNIQNVTHDVSSHSGKFHFCTL